ncbi:MAG: AAA family ATPase [Bacillales bacterium]|jgi:SpoVK/Ycf46/Vps4 family AAA+-type ATPase|nr:AAA family ATPase [Bacillales bacterium]
MTKTKKDIETLNYKIKTLEEQFKQLKEEDKIASTLNKLKEIEVYIGKLEGTISGYAISFNNTLNEYKTSIKDEVKTLSNVALETNIVNKVVNEAVDKLTTILKKHYQEKVIDNELLSQSLDDVINNLKEDLHLSVQSNLDLQTSIKPLGADEYTHMSFKKLLSCLKAGIIPMLVGPAGTGKSTAVEQVARALNLRFYTANRVQNAFELTGYTDAVGKYVSTQFYEAYKNGGIFFFDEVDASAPEALVTINTAISQGYMAFPGTNIPVPMHKDFKMVAAGNTYGNGASREYCGRNALDAATLDRFMIIEWDYDKGLEQKLINDTYLLNFCWGLRNVITNNRIHIIISTRGILATLKIVRIPENVFSVAEALKGNLFEGLNKDTVTKLIAGLDALDKANTTVHSSYLYSSNPYYIASKSLISTLK